MTYFADLSAYAYLAGDEVISIPKGFIVFDAPYTRINVGWLSVDHPFTQGTPPEVFSSALAWLSRWQRINIMRGFHRCEFCAHDGHEVQGNGELRVPGEEGTVYAAPIMLGHYVAEHQYLPPEQFVSAALAYAASGDQIDEPVWIPATARRRLY